MGELATAMRMMNKMSTAIMKYPSGRYGLVGNVPSELTHEKLSGYSMVQVSNVWETEQEVIDALLKLGITRFQVSSLKWYEAKAN